jgi:hypothetical protein
MFKKWGIQMGTQPTLQITLCLILYMHASSLPASRKLFAYFSHVNIMH